jgi:ComF family protein
MCPYCRQERPAYRELRSWSIFEGRVRTALHALKYRRDLGLGEALAPSLMDFVEELAWPVDTLVPVPLAPRRLAERGYNQVALIARLISSGLRLSYSPDALVRVRETRSQVGLDRPDRQANVRDAFRGVSGKVRQRTILLVDDVATTGATLSACARALRAAGAADVYAVTVARAPQGSTMMQSR